MGKHSDEEQQTAEAVQAVVASSHGLRARQKMNYSLPTLDMGDLFADGANSASSNGTGKPAPKRSKAKPKDREREKRESKNREPEDEEEQEDEEVTRCVCERAQENFGTMIQCDQCLVWQHCECVGLTSKRMPKHYFCEQCKPVNHPYYKLHPRQATSNPQPSAKSATPAKKRNTMNSMDAADSFLSLVPPASENQQGSSVTQDRPLDAEPVAAPARTSKVTGKKRKADSATHEADSGDNTDAAKADQPEKRSKLSSTDSLDSAESGQSVKAGSRWAGKPSKVRSSKKTRVTTLEQEPKSPAENMEAVPDQSRLSSGSSATSAILPAVNCDSFKTTAFPPNSQNTTPREMNSALVQVPIQEETKPAPAIAPGQKPSTTKSKSAPVCPPSPSNAFTASYSANASQDVVPNLKPRQQHHRIALADIKRRVSQVSEYLASLNQGESMTCDEGGHPRAAGTTGVCLCSRKPSHSDAASSSSSSANSDNSADTSLLTPPLSTTSPSPVFQVVQKPVAGCVNTDTAATVNGEGLGSLDGPSSDQCDACGCIKSTEESSSVIMSRLLLRLKNFHNTFDNC
ncbi:hypothetical protein BC830DRAFT_1165382 [Chytriomyces sp. MP71]|nr:hypothetical protein BC830DRAFT_855164 [Chytriomyces sp. MP71]KAI8619375.1 hypothetical protein BC830DRAFT_1165382 [Chytriomyces sp. MP71]